MVAAPRSHRLCSSHRSKTALGGWIAGAVGGTAAGLETNFLRLPRLAEQSRLLLLMLLLLLLCQYDASSSERAPGLRAALPEVFRSMPLVKRRMASSTGSVFQLSRGGLQPASGNRANQLRRRPCLDR